MGGMPRNPSLRAPRGVSVVLAAASVVAAVLVPSPARADEGGSVGDGTSSGDDTPSVTVEGATSEREASASVSTLQADRAAVRSQVAAAKAARDHQFDKWAMAHLAMGAAKEKVEKAALLAVQAQQRVDAAQVRVQEYASEAFMNPPALESMAVLAMSESEDAGWAHEVLSISADQQSRVLDELASARESAQLRTERATRIAAEAAEAESQSKSELESLEAQLREQRRLDAQIDQRLDAALAEAAALREVDADAADELESEERALAEDSKAASGGGSSAPPATSDSGGSGSSGGSSAAAGTTPTTTAKPKTTTPPPSPPSGVVTWSDVTKVGSFWVHRSIASNVQGLLSAASSAGFSLSGGGFRDPASQIELRQAHCGPTYYDIYEKPASQCSPPTAIPGRSMHERGLALDIKSGGALITSRSNPAYQWLAANASAYGFFNLPSEPWHWSTNGS